MNFNFNRFLNFFLIFMLVYLGMQLFFPQPAELPDEDLVIQLPAERTIGTPVTMTLVNTTTEDITFADECPGEYFDVSLYDNGQWVSQSATADTCGTLPDTLLAGQAVSVSYQDFQQDIFATPGRYRVEVPVTIGGEDRTFQRDITIDEPGFFGTIWREGFYRPMYNALVFFAEIAGHSLGWGVVLLTLAIRVLLIYPFHQSMVAQRKLQKLQPEMEKIRKKYKDNQQMQAMEMMGLYKKHKVNPLSSCLPILIQMPFLIALFWIVQGATGAHNFVLLYPALSEVAITTIDPYFFGLSLISPNILVLPLVVAVLQYLQMRLAMQRAKNMPKPDSDNPMAEAMYMTTKYMQYVLPVMVGIFTATLPAAVGLYWGASTVFGIAQQLVVNKMVK